MVGLGISLRSSSLLLGSLVSLQAYEVARERKLIYVVLAGQLRWDQHGIDILGEVPGGTSIPFGWPLNHRRMKYFSYTVSWILRAVDQQKLTF